MKSFQLRQPPNRSQRTVPCNPDRFPVPRVATDTPICSVAHGLQKLPVPVPTKHCALLPPTIVKRTYSGTVSISARSLATYDIIRQPSMRPAMTSHPANTKPQSNVTNALFVLWSWHGSRLRPATSWNCSCYFQHASMI